MFHSKLIGQSLFKYFYVEIIKYFIINIYEMKLLHNVVVNVFVKYGEDLDLIKEKLLSLIPLDLEKEKLEVKDTKAHGFQDMPIHSLEIHLEKERHTKAFLENLLEKLTRELKDVLLQQKESRLDEEHHFFIRLDKQKLLKDNEWFITDSGNCFHIKMLIAAFPANRENSLKVVEQIFK